MQLVTFIFAIILAFLTVRPSLPALHLPPAVTPSSQPTPKVTPHQPQAKGSGQAADNQPWGVARQLTEHTWRIRIANDSAMGSPDEILQALNNLRAHVGSQPLRKDDRLCQYAATRAQLFNSLRNTDEHRGFDDFLTHQDGFQKLGYAQLGENSSYGYIMSGVHLIEFVYNSDPDHSRNQLDPKWDHGCVGVAGSATDLIFATAPL